ncbi:MAG: type II toxin-antitoxin system RelE/ParE family toxin [Phycisphaerae bacterium]|nr:type II toxin-antitoxin system RelE/ParE family toxin [Phycisphaerae bacterium]
MRIKLLSSAIEDLHEGHSFYERQGEGLGEYFFDSLFSDIDSLTLYGGIHPKVFGYHRLLSKRFPYAIYYRMEEESVVVVWRILDLRRNPRRLRQSLGHGGTTGEMGQDE